MNKKFLSAILFGALAVSSTGTFVSCKDYDDDIESINKELSDVKSQIAALQTEVANGNWVTSVTPVEGGFTVTFKGGQSYTIVNGKDGAAGKPGEPGKDGKGTTVEVKDGYWYLNGEKTEFVAVKKDDLGKVKVPYVNAANMWVFFDKDGNEIVSKYNALGATYAVKANGVFTLFVPDAKGEMQKIELPTAASMISALKVNLADGDFQVDVFEFQPFHNNQNAKKTWKGTRAITTDKYIISSDEVVGMRVDPVSVDAKTIPFSFVDSNNNVLTGIALAAQENKELLTKAAYGNGLYTLTMEQATLKDKAALDAFNEQFMSGTKSVLFALNANNAFRSDYQLTVSSKEAAASVFAPIYLNKKETAVSEGMTVTINAGEDNKFFVATPSRLYDMWLEVAPEYVNMFGLEFDQTVPSFKVTKNPDQITAANFPLTIHTMNNLGTVEEVKLTVNLSEVINTPAEYAVVEHAIKKDANKNYFSADLAIMKKALGSKLDSWKIKADAKNPAVKFYKDAKCKQEVLNAGIVGNVVSKIADANKLASATGTADANFMQFVVTNADASKAFEVNKVYYAKVTFNTANGEEVNSIVVPFKFTIPTLASMFVEEPAVFQNHVAYAYMNVDDQTTGEAAYKLERAFKAYPAGVTLAMETETDIVKNKKSSDFATVGTAFTSDAKITLKDNNKNAETGLQAGYGKELIVKATATDYAGWKYAAKEGEYTFKIKVLSPIYEGSVSAIKSTVEIPATSVEGYKVTNNDIQGKTYNAIAYKVLQDKENDWTRPEIAKVEAKTDNKRVVNIANAAGEIQTDWFEAINAKNATVDNKNVLQEGYINVKPENIKNSTATKIFVKVTDVWGYAKVNPIDVMVTVK